MIESIEQFAAWLGALPPLGIYLVLFAISVGENLVPPIPGDVAVVIAGSLVGFGTIALVPTFAIAVVGSVLGFLAMYVIGRRLGDAIDDPDRMRWLPSGPVATVEGWLSRWGYGVVAANRFLSGGRSVIALLAGASGLRLPATALWSTVSSLLWTGVLVGAGYAVGSEWDRVLDALRVYGRGVTIGLALVGIVVAVRWGLRRRARRRRTERRKETAKTPPGPERGQPRG